MGYSGAGDYEWPYRFWQMDLGGDFRVRTDIVPSVTQVVTGYLTEGNSDFPTFDITDPNIQVIFASLSFVGIAGESTGDLDIYLIDLTGNVVTASNGYSNPEHFYFDLREYTDAQKLGTWTIEIDGYASDNNYTLTIIQGTWKLIFESELHPNDSAKIEFSLNKKSVNIKNIPTNATGLITGDIWNDGGFLAIAP